MPSNSQLTVQLVQPQGAVVDPAASSTVVLVQSPVIGFKTGLVSLLKVTGGSSCSTVNSMDAA